MTRIAVRRVLRDRRKSHMRIFGLNDGRGGGAVLSIVGRDELVDRVAEMALGGGSVLLSGAAGIGKSTVLGGVVARLADAGARVLRCAPGQEDARLPFVALTDVFSEVGDDEFAGLGVVVRRAVEAALLRGDASGAPDPLAVRLGVLQLVKGLVERGRVAIVVDDLQWVDPSSAEVLGFVGRRLSPAGLSIVATVRAVGDEVAEFRNLLPAATEQHSVGPLEEEALIPLLERRAGGVVPRFVATEVYRATGGNPLFALEIAAALARRRALPVIGEPLPVPIELSRLMGERLIALDASVREMLLVASTVARPTVTLLRDVGCSAVMEDLGAAAAAGVAHVGADGVVVFSHPLMRSVVYAEASLAQRMSVHERVVGAVDDPVERAWHVALSSAVEDEAVAAELSGAAAIARSRGAAGMAGELAQLAAHRTPRADVEMRAERLLAASDHYLMADRYEEARQAADAVLDMRPSRPKRARAQIMMHRVTMPGEETADRLAEAAADAEGVPELEAYVAVLSAWRQARHARIDLMAIDARRALDAAERAGHLPTIIEALDSLLVSLRVSGSDDYLPTMEKALGLVGKHSGQSAWRLCKIQARHLAGLRRFEEARAAAREALRLAYNEGGMGPAANVLYAMIAIEITAGDYPAALRAAHELDKLVPDDIANSSTLAGLAQAEFAAGSIQRGMEFATRGRAFCEKRDIWIDGVMNTYLVGVGYLMNNEVEAAIQAFRAARELNQISSVPYAFGYPWAPELAEALLLTGEVAEARAILAEGVAAARTRKAHENRDVQELLGDLDRVDALIKAAEGHLDEAAGQLEQLIERLAGRAPIEIARAQVALAGVERRRRRRGAARGLLADARARCERAGAAPWVRIIDDEIARFEAGHRVGEDALTPTEERVVAMVVQGATNREIAGALSISVKTVEATLSRIYRKTGLHSRIELVKAHVGS